MKASGQTRKRRLMIATANELIHAAYRALLSREPDEAGFNAYVKVLRETGDAATVLAGIASSDEHWRRELMVRGPEFVRTLFLGLLGREPDAGAMDSYTRLLQEDGVGSVIAAVSFSEEHREYLRRCYPRAAGNLSLSPVAYRADIVARAYWRFNGRQPHAAEIGAHLADQSPVGIGLSARFGAPVRGVQPRVLIFGAYGNGNLGDAYQAIAVQEHLKSAWRLPDDAFFSCSLLAKSDYPFAPGRKLPAEAILDPDVVNAFDCVVIGGGGLLAHPHAPVNSAEWARAIHAPLVLLGVGAGEAAADEHADLLDRAWMVSARDELSKSFLELARPDAILLRDPILCLPDLAPLQEFDEGDWPVPQPIDVLWILKYPANAGDEDFLRWIAAYLGRKPQGRHVVLAMEPACDGVLEHWLPGVPVVATLCLLELMTYLKASARVVTMRYHGAIVAARAGRYFQGFSQPKIRELVDAYPGMGRYVEAPEDFEVLLHSEAAPTGPVLSVDREAARIVGALARLRSDVTASMV